MKYRINTLIVGQDAADQDRKNMWKVVDRLKSDVNVLTQRSDVISSMLRPDKEEERHRREAYAEKDIQHLQKTVQQLWATVDDLRKEGL